ncbi:MAG: hypothetical protein NT154_32525, partial [Verrucomicrobia bacterium]|nr:hypothetical protein [Verrucomicrobiota bacterium]
LGDAYSIAVDATNRIVVSPANNPGRLMLYSASGSLANANFATVVPASPLARGPGGMWTTDVYAITDGGDLVRIALDGTTNTMGSGFGNIEGMTFGPDGALYASDFPNARVWRIAPQPQQWSTNNLPSGLIAWWQAEGNMLDSAGPHHGTGSTAPTYGPGRFGRAFQFNGTDQSLAIPNSYSDLDGWTQFTLEAWFNLDSTSDRSGGQAIFSKVGNVSDHVNYNQGYQFTLANNASRVDLQFNTNGQAWPGFSTRVNLGAPLLTNTWYHLVGTYDHNAVKIYLNSVPLVTNVVGPATIRNSSSTLRISKDDNLNVLFAGRIDDARIYNRALTVAEIASLCAGPNPPLTRPVLKHTPKGDGKFTFEWDSISNQTYHVESATNLVNPRWQPVGWQPVGDSIIATNTATSISYPIGGEIQRFYRVVTP